MNTADFWIAQINGSDLHEVVKKDLADFIRAADALEDMFFLYDHTPSVSLDDVRKAAEAYRKACAGGRG